MAIKYTIAPQFSCCHQNKDANDVQHKTSNDLIRQIIVVKVTLKIIVVE